MGVTVLQSVPVIYSNHAHARMLDRAIFKKQVRRILRRPERCYAQGRKQVAEYTTAAGAVIRVVYVLMPEAAEHSLYIVTAIRLGKLKGAFQRGPIETIHDRACDLAYVGLLHGEIAETVEEADGIYYDLDSYGDVLGVEICGYSQYQTAEGDLLSIFERLARPAR